MSKAQSTDGGTQTETITVGTTADDEPITLPVVEILTGRTFITGKSGSGKSNSASVLVEDLLEQGYPCLIVDTDGEYYGLKEEFELLHAGADDECDIQVGPEHAGKLATLALEENVPIILDVSGYLDESEGSAIIRETARELFDKEKTLQKPFLLVVEEIHEYIPEGGGLDETGQMLVRVAKRGRKRGLGLAGISQRPADVKKDVITQANLLVWHRLTWENDTKVVRRVVSKDVADAVGDLADGEAFVQADWREADVERVQFRRKRTFDAGATPGLEDVDRPELKSIGDELLGELDEISDRADRRRDEVAQLEAELEDREDRIEELEAELENQENVASAAQQMADALRGADDEAAAEDPEDFDAQLAEKNQRITALERERDELADRVDELEAEVERLQVAADRIEQAERIETQLEQAREALGMDVETSVATNDAEVAELRDRVSELESENDRLRAQTDAEINEEIQAYGDFLGLESVQQEIEVAKAECGASKRYVKGVLAEIIAENGPVSYDAIAERLGVSTTSDVSKAASELERRKIVTKDRGDDGMLVDLNTDGIEAVRKAAAEREKTEQLMEEI